MRNAHFTLICLSLLAVSISVQSLTAQNNYETTTADSTPNIERPLNFIAFGAQYGFQIPAADMADRYGNNYQAMISMDIYNRNWNGFYGVEVGMLFGNTVKEDVMAPYRVSAGVLLGADGNPGDIFLRLRGNYFGIYTNKTVLPSRPNSASGLNIGLGVGLLQHKVRIVNDTDNIGQIVGDYEKGYDRLTRGLALKQSLSYQHLGTKRSVNYSIGLSCSEGFTESVRQINFDTGADAKGRRMDILISLNVKWFIPIAKSGDRSKNEVFY